MRLCRGVVDLVGEVVGHGGCGGGAGLLGEEVLLLLLTDGHGGEAGEYLHGAAVFFVEDLFGAVGHDEDGAAGLVGDPGEEDAVGDEGRCDAHDVEKSLVDAEELRAAAFQADSAGAGIAGEDGVKEGGVQAGGGDPVIEGLIGAVFPFDADAGAVGAAEGDGGVDELLQDGGGAVDEGAGDALHAFKLQCDGARTGGGGPGTRRGRRPRRPQGRCRRNLRWPGAFSMLLAIDMIPAG